MSPQAIQGSLRALNLEFIDLLLLHAPGKPHLRAETWRAVEDLHDEARPHLHLANEVK